MFWVSGPNRQYLQLANSVGFANRRSSFYDCISLPCLWIFLGYKKNMVSSPVNVAIENSISDQFGLEALAKYKAYLADQTRMRKCYTCSDLVPSQLYQSHLEFCPPAGKLMAPIDGSLIEKFKKEPAPPSAMTALPNSVKRIPGLLQVLKGTLYSHAIWPSEQESCQISTQVPGEPPEHHLFRIHAVSLNLGLNTSPQDRATIYSYGEVKLSYNQMLFYSGSISSILTQGQNLSDVDPRRSLTTKGLRRKYQNGGMVDVETQIPVEINGCHPVISELNGAQLRLPVELTMIFYGNHLKPVH